MTSFLGKIGKFPDDFISWTKHAIFTEWILFIFWAPSLKKTTTRYYQLMLHAFLGKSVTNNKNLITDKNWLTQKFLMAAKFSWSYISPHCDLVFKTEPFFSIWHSSSYWCITVPNLVTECLVIKKTSSGQLFIDILILCCDLTLEHRKPIFHRILWLKVIHHKTKFGYKMDQKFRRYSRNSHITIT